MAGGFFYQKITITRKGCQIDSLTQLRTDVLYAVEIKFSRNTLGVEIVEEMRMELTQLDKPKCCC